MGQSLSRVRYTLVSPQAEACPDALDGQVPPFARGLLVALVGLPGSGRSLVAQFIRETYQGVELTSIRECARNTVGAVLGETYDFVAGWETEEEPPPRYDSSMKAAVDQMEALLRTHKQDAWLEAALCHCPTHLVALSDRMSDVEWFQKNGFAVVLVVRPDRPQQHPQQSPSQASCETLAQATGRFLERPGQALARLRHGAVTTTASELSSFSNEYHNSDDNEHPRETDLQFDYVLRNEGTRDDLRDRVDMLLDDMQRSFWEDAFAAVTREVQPYYDRENEVRYGFVPPTLRGTYEIVEE